MTLFQVGINKISVNFDLLHYLFRFEQKNSNICYSAKQILIHNIGIWYVFIPNSKMTPTWRYQQIFGKIHACVYVFISTYVWFDWTYKHWDVITFYQKRTKIGMLNFNCKFIVACTCLRKIYHN